MAGPTPKAEVAALIDIWVRRSGLQKQQVAARAGFDDYNEFYRAYLDQLDEQLDLLGIEDDHVRALSAMVRREAAKALHETGNRNTMAEVCAP